MRFDVIAKKVFKKKVVNQNINLIQDLGNSIREFLEEFSKHFCSKLPPESESIFTETKIDTKSGKIKMIQYRVKLNDILKGKVHIEFKWILF